MTLLYLDCIGGASGDMLLASLIDGGASVEAINDVLGGLGVAGLRVTTARVERQALRCTTVNVVWDRQHEHEHGRSYADIRALLAHDSFDVVPRVRARALAAFRLLAEAEGRIHGVHPDEVHFHEVGSQDSIADVVGVCVALELLGIVVVECSPLPLGRGQIISAHGVLPLPAPATLELLRGIPVQGVDIAKELVTPTGAALIASLTTRFGGLPAMSIDAIGYGAGGRDLAERPNIVRSLIGSPTVSGSLFQSGAGPGPGAGSSASASASAGPAERERDSAPQVVLLETNLDDCSPELIPDASQAAMAAGALDVWTSQVLMKKGRPGFVLHALARAESAGAVAQALLSETSALGVRMCTYERVELERRFVLVSVQGHQVSVKVAMQADTVVHIAPEHDDCARAAAALGLPVKEVFARALEAGRVAVGVGQLAGLPAGGQP